jgi:hypothetical protein
VDNVSPRRLPALLPKGHMLEKCTASLQYMSPLLADSVAKVPKTWTVIFSAETYTSESRY